MEQRGIELYPHACPSQSQIQPSISASSHHICFGAILSHAATCSSLPVFCLKTPSLPKAHPETGHYKNKVCLDNNLEHENKDVLQVQGIVLWGHCCGECGRDGTLCCRVSWIPAPCIDACMFSIPCIFFFVSALCFCSSVFAQAFLLTPCVFSASSVIMLLSPSDGNKNIHTQTLFFFHAPFWPQNVQYVAKLDSTGHVRPCHG